MIDARQIGALAELVREEAPPNVALVDGAIFYTTGEADPASFAILEENVRSRHVLQSVSPNIDILPGIRLAIDPRCPRQESRLKVMCGPKTLLVLDAQDLPITLPATEATEPRIANLALPPALASEAYVFATPTGRFPALGRIYRYADVYRWGSLKAATFEGAPARRGQVDVEPAGWIEQQGSPLDQHATTTTEKATK